MAEKTMDNRVARIAAAAAAVAAFAAVGAAAGQAMSEPDADTHTVAIDILFW